MDYKKIGFATLAYFFSSFVIQGMLGFAIGGDYFSGITIMRQTPLLYLSMSSTVLTGIALAILYPLTNLQGTPIQKGFKFGLIAGLIIVPFIALDLPGRFMIPNEGKWIFIQAILGMTQSATAGVLIGLVYRKDTIEH